MEAAPAIADNVRRDLYVYVHRRATDGTVFYVGRGTGRRVSLRAGRNQYWRNIVAKHGFTWQKVAEGLSVREANEREVLLIAQFGRSNLCNLTDGGEGTVGYVLPPETLAAAAMKRTGQKRTAATRRRMSDARKGRPMSEQAKLKLAATNKGLLPSIATREGFNRWLTPAIRAEKSRRMSEKLSRAVLCLDTGALHASLEAAAKWCGGKHANISHCCAGRRGTAYGYHWRYAD